MRQRWNYSPMVARPHDKAVDQSLRSHVDVQMRRLSDYIDSLDRAARNGPIPGSYEQMHFTLSSFPIVATGVADIIVLPSERQPIALSWCIRGTGAISCDLAVIANAGGSILATTPLSVSGTDVNANVLQGAGVFNTDRIGTVSLGAPVWLSVTNIGGVLQFVHVVLFTKDAGGV